MTKRNCEGRMLGKRKGRASRITPQELDERLTDIATTAGALTKLRNEEGNNQRIEAMTVHLCGSAVRLFERSFNVEEGRLAGMARILSEGPYEARSSAASAEVQERMRATTKKLEAISKHAGAIKDDADAPPRDPILLINGKQLVQGSLGGRIRATTRIANWVIRQELEGRR